VRVSITAEKAALGNPLSGGMLAMSNGDTELVAT